MKYTLLHYGLLLFLIIQVAGCKKDNSTQPADPVTSQVVTDWADLSLTITRETPGFSPPVAARAFGYIGVALYEALVPGMPGAQSLQGQINGLAPGTVPVSEAGVTYHWEIVANAVMAQSFRHFYRNTTPAHLSTINLFDSTTHNRLAQGIPDDVIQRSRARGIAVADAIQGYAATDGQDLCYLTNFPDFTPPTGDGLWVPTPPAFSKPLQPYWGNVRPFLGVNLIPVQPAGCPAYSTSPGSLFYQEGLEVYTVSLHLTPEQRTIAEYWSDDPGKTATPPGHSVSVTSQIIRVENLDLFEASELMARVCMGLHDAFISCWRSKYVWNTLRPVTYIRQLFDPAWLSMLTTPPFPEYTSGHSVQTGSLAAILTDRFGETYTFTDHTHQHRTDIDGSPRTYTSFAEMADEAAISRLYGGIHYRSAIDHGVEQGNRIGNNILQLLMRP